MNPPVKDLRSSFFLSSSLSPSHFTSLNIPLPTPHSSPNDSYPSKQAREGAGGFHQFDRANWSVLSLARSPVVASSAADPFPFFFFSPPSSPADRGAEFVPAREWMRICFELLDLLKAHKKGIRRAAVNSFGYIAKAIGPQDVLSVLLTNLRVQERQSRVCSTVAIGEFLVLSFRRVEKAPSSSC